MKEIILPYAGIVLKNNIVHCTFKNIELGFPEIKEVATCIQALTDKLPYLILADLSHIRNITNQGRRILSDYSDLPFCNGTAILINKPRYECVQDLIKSYQTKYPIEVFYTEKEAEDWLKSLSIDC
jgi:hypothetical protein